MLELKKLCDAFEELSAVERAALMAEKSLVVLAKLHELSFPLSDPIDMLVGFVIGACTADGKINEKEYLMIYPALVRTFGDDFDFASVKSAFRCEREGQKAIADYTEKMLRILHMLDEGLKWDVIMLCLCIVSSDGRITWKERRYIRRLCESD